MTTDEPITPGSLDNEPINVSLVDDDTAFRNTVARYLDCSAACRCVSAYGSAEEALRHLPKERPHIVLMDINLPGMSGIELVAKLRGIVPSMKLIMFTVFEDSEQIFLSLAAGAFGYLTKNTRPAKILEAIQEVHQGGSPMSGSIARKVVESFHRSAAATSAAAALSQRETEVLHYLAKGYPYKQIADEMAIGIGTVRTYIQRIYEKLHVHSRTEAVAKFLRKN